MTDAFQFLQSSFPHFAILVLVTLYIASRNTQVTVSWTAKTVAPEPSKAELLELKAQAEEHSARLRREQPTKRTGHGAWRTAMRHNLRGTTRQTGSA